MVSTDILEQQAAYYRARAREYDEWWYRRGRYDRGAGENQRWFDETAEVISALDESGVDGDVLELAPGTGIWTERLVRTARSVTAVDAAPEMVALNRAKVHSDRVSYVIGDLFAWRPDRSYDAVVFGFWISHVPRERLSGFLGMVATALRPGGKVFFVDGRREPSSTAADHVLPAAESQTMTRLLNDGQAFEIVKNFYEPAWLGERFREAGLDVAVRETATYFVYGTGTR